jgi:hypothetical protein
MFQTSELRRFDYTAVDDSMPPITSVFAYDQGTKSMVYIDYDAHLNFKDKWFYKFQPGFGIAEWRDDYPSKKVVMSTPIGWGTYHELGDDYINYPRMSLLQSWPPAISKGVQIVHFEKLLPWMRLSDGKHYDDVLQFTYLQSWDGKPGVGGRYWMAKGVGPIAVQWLAQNPTNPRGAPIIQTSRMDATISTVFPRAQATV